MAALLAFLTVAAVFYRIQYQGAEEALQKVELEAESRQAEIEQLTQRMRSVAALDLQHTRELENDKKRIAQLERDVADGRRRLQVSATCPNLSSRAAARVDAPTRAGLTDAAQRNYFTLRRRIETITKQLNGLQHYVREQCLI
ncbi:lysis protein [Sodalis praecaptivus]|uniref:lysis protein n=1 Tax=Sodalis praecaptivus TaxID=1239307 RepID=UPI0031F9EEA0